MARFSGHAAACFCAALLSAPLAWAQTDPPASGVEAAQSERAADKTAEQKSIRAQERAALLGALRAAENEAEANFLAGRLWRLWRTGPDIVATGLLKDAVAHLRVSDRETALEILDQITRDYPAWAEGWNLRATVLFMERRFDESLADIEQTLVLEPAHFGALAGRALIHIEAGRYVEAREAIREAMLINPWVPERHFLETLPEEEKI